MNAVLTKFVPSELADKVARLVHEMHLRPCLHALKHQTVWVLYNGHVSFLVCEKQNYYRLLAESRQIYT